MDWKGIAKYLLAVDYMERLEKMDKELIGPLERKLGRPVAPCEADLETGLKVAGIRMAAVITTPLVISSRITGLDYLYTRLEEQIRKLMSYKSQ